MAAAPRRAGLPSLLVAASGRSGFPSACMLVPRREERRRSPAIRCARACCTAFPCVRRRREEGDNGGGGGGLVEFRGIDPGAVVFPIPGQIRDDSVSQFVAGLLPVAVAATTVAALANPSTFSWVSKEYYAPALGGIMLSIGVRLSIDDFVLAFQRPVPLSIGYIAQYVIKPLLGFLVARAFGAPDMFYAGFILTACVAGAQLSSYASFLSNGDVALSILLTGLTTISSVLMTPLLTRLLIGSVVPVDAIAMSKSILQVVLVPVSLGLLLNSYAKSVVNVIRPVMPFVAMVCTSLCIGSPLAINRSQIMSSAGLQLLLPIVVFHSVSFMVGYLICQMPFSRQEEPVSRTISLCTGMQSSTLSGLLATQFLGSCQAVPAAFSVVVMAIMGLVLGSFWGNGSRIRDILTLPFHLQALVDETS